MKTDLKNLKEKIELVALLVSLYRNESDKQLELIANDLPGAQPFLRLRYENRLEAANKKLIQLTEIAEKELEIDSINNA